MKQQLLRAAEADPPPARAAWVTEGDSLALLESLDMPVADAAAAGARTWRY